MLSWLARCCGCGGRHHDQSQRAPAGAPRSVQMTDRGASYVRLQQALDQAAQQMAQMRQDITLMMQVVASPDLVASNT